MTDHVTTAGWGELFPGIEALKSTVPPRETVAAGGFTEMSDVTPGRSATSPLQERTRDAVRITRKRLIAARIPARCARSLGPGKRQNRMPT
jgi:hypothetical protein